MTSKKTFGSPIFIFYWLSMISIVLVQPALSGRTLGSGGGGRMIGVHPTPSPTNSGSKPGGHGSPGYRSLGRGPFCNKVRYANCIPAGRNGRPCEFGNRCSHNGPPAPK
ncbi:unnamed protein product [Coffea canephora]|uniref:Uncharacterized protein n=1 Tax=Coffea canephora TaxID=49390 RepID=A0A068TWW4_COFCA|nr:unnamed protein product [Coffea canephora]